MNELVSVIMPVYNAEKWVGQAIESVINQTYDNWELIIINDGSNDRTQDVCCEYASKDKRIKVFEQKNKGPGAARNYGLSKIQGQFFTMIDSDDELFESALEVYVNAINSYGTDMVVAGFRKSIVENDSSTDYYINEQTIINSKDGLNTKEFSELLKERLMSSNWNKLYSRKLSNIRFNESLSLNEDVLFSLTAASYAESIAVVPELVYLYRIQNNDSLSLRMNKDYFDSLELIDRVITKDNSISLIMGIKRWIADYMFNYLKRCCIEGNSVSERKKCLEEAKESIIFKKYGTISVANTLNRKLSVVLLRINAYKTYINIMRRKGQ